MILGPRIPVSANGLLPGEAEKGEIADEVAADESLGVVDHTM